MPIHDWTRVEAGTFHDFHNSWIIHLKEAMNAGRLPPDFYAMSEQHLGRKISDVLTLHTSDPERLRNLPAPTHGKGAVSLAEAPPQVSQTMVLTPLKKSRRRTLTIRHTSGHRIVALIEILSPGNKTGADAVGEFVAKAEQAIRSGIHLLVIDLFPPGRHNPEGIHAEIVDALDGEPYELPEESQLTIASYSAGKPPVVYLEHPTAGSAVPEMPLFLTPEHYVNLPLERTYMEAYQGMPAFWREVLEGQRPAPGKE